MKITKKSGNIVIYDDEKIVGSIMKANADTGERLSAAEAAYLSDVVIGRLAKAKDMISTKDIREGVYRALSERGLMLTARKYHEFEK